MPRSVLVLSSDTRFFDSVRTVLLADPRFSDGDDNLHCDGTAAPLTNLYPVQMSAVEWEDWPSGETDMPDPRGLPTLVLECRDPEWVAEVGRLLAVGLEAPAWFVDSVDAVWPVGELDPARVVLL